MIAAIYDPSTGGVLKIINCATAAQAEKQLNEGEAIFFDCPFDTTHIIDGNAVRITPEQTPGDIQRELTDAVQRHLDATAIQRGYDDIRSLVTYVDDLNPRFDAEGRAGKAWRGAVWTYCVTALNDVLAGARPIPTADELIAELPAMEWPN